MKAICLFIALFAFYNFAFAQTKSSSEINLPIVLKAVAPNVYPAAALAVKAEGEVKIRVKINKDGNVKSAQILSGHDLLKRISELVAFRWKFVSSSEDKERFAELSFIYRIVSEREKEETFFNPPYQVVFVYNPPRIDTLTTIDPLSIDKKNK